MSACSSSALATSSRAPIAAQNASQQTSETIAVEHPAPGEEKPRADPGPLHWETSEPDARARARREEMPMLVYLRADWAVASVHMEREVWSDLRVILEARRFVAVKIDLTSAEGDAEIYDERYGAPTVPAVVVLDANGRQAALISGPTTVDEVLKAMKRAFE